MKGFVFAALAAPALATRDSTISKVIELLDGLKAKVQSDMKAEAALMEEFSEWCDTQKTETSYAIKDEERVISEQSAHVEGSAAKMDEAKASVEELVPKIGAKETEKKTAEKVRTDEHKDFLAKEKELVEAEDMLRRAYGILKRHMTSGMSFAQGGAAKMEEVVKALGAIVSAAATMGSKHIAEVKSFMETADELRMGAPQASSSNYESKSGGILSAVDSMRDEVTDNLREARKAETNARHAHELLVQSLTNQVATFNKELAAAKANGAAATSANGKAQKALKAEESKKQADTEYLASINSECSEKAESWSTRQADADAEMAAIEEAKNILGQGVVVLAQTGSSTRRQADEKRDQVVKLLRNLGRRFNSFGLLQAASSAQEDPFAKVRGLISDMIAKLEKQARDEQDHKAFCDTELKKNSAKKSNKQAALDKYTTRFNAAQAKSTSLKNEIGKLEAELKELAAAMAEATKLRNKEKAENLKTMDDNKVSATAVGSAIQRLREFYAAKVEVTGTTEFSFTQKEASPKFDFAAKRGDAAHSIIAILQTAQEDFDKLASETQASEDAAADEFAKYMQEGEVTTAKKKASVMGKTSEMKSVGVSAAQTSDDISVTEAELDAVQKVLDNLHEQCANKAMSFEERKQRREAEIAGLQEALQVLSESASFLQKGMRRCGPKGGDRKDGC